MNRQPLPPNAITKDVHISDVKPGDTILHEGKLTTVSKSNIRRSPDNDLSIFGDSYHAGHKPVILVTFTKPLKK